MGNVDYRVNQSKQRAPGAWRVGGYPLGYIFILGAFVVVLAPSKVLLIMKIGVSYLMSSQ